MWLPIFFLQEKIMIKKSVKSNKRENTRASKVLSTFLDLKLEAIKSALNSAKGNGALKIWKANTKMESWKESNDSNNIHFSFYQIQIKGT